MNYTRALTVSLFSLAMIMPSVAAEPYYKTNQNALQVINELNGGYQFHPFHPNTWTKFSFGDEERDLPDTSFQEKVRDAASAQGPSGFTTGCGENRSVMFPQDDGISRVCTNVTRDGVAQSISTSGGHGIIYKTVVVDGGTVVVCTKTTETKVVTWNDSNFTFNISYDGGSTSDVDC